MVFSDTKWKDGDSSWNKEQIPMRKKKEIEEFKKEYPELKN